MYPLSTRYGVFLPSLVVLTKIVIDQEPHNRASATNGMGPSCRPFKNITSLASPSPRTRVWQPEADLRLIAKREATATVS